jgi:hypothetical protein
MTSTAVAQMACAPRSDIVSKLAVKYKEEQIAMGLGDDGRLIEVFVSISGSFTILISYSNGQSCIAAAGEGWQIKNLSIKQ